MKMLQYLTVAITCLRCGDKVYQAYCDCKRRQRQERAAYRRLHRLNAENAHYEQEQHQQWQGEEAMDGEIDLQEERGAQFDRDSRTVTIAPQPMRQMHHEGMDGANSDATHHAGSKRRVKGASSRSSGKKME